MDEHGRLVAATAELFGDAPAARLARYADVELRVAQHWLKGRPADAGVLDRLEREVEIARRLRLRGHLTEVVEASLAEGLHRETVGGQLATVHSELLGRKIS
ncbi:hypothetical protein ACIKTA_06860 [Hansschlegelia beijingensis]